MLNLRRRRMILAFWAMALAFALVTWHLYNIQLVRGNSLALQALEISSEEVALEEFVRGEITDRHNIPLAGGYYANRAVVFPSLMRQKDHELKKLAAILNVKPEELDKKAQRGAFYISRPLTGEQYNALRNAAPAGVYLLPVYQKYGDDPLAVHVAGHLGKIKSTEQYQRLQKNSAKKYHLGDWVGQSGLEFFYERELKGSYPKRLARVPVDARGRVIKGPGLLVNSEGTDPGRRNVVTTIDYRVQRIVEEVMDQHVASGAVVVMQAGGGDILAMSSRPDYHPAPSRMETLVNEPAGDIFVDYCTSLVQPGSIFKIVLAAAAVEKGIVDSRTRFNCAGANAEPVRCWSDGGHGIISFDDAFAVSCNPAFVEIGRRLGAATIIEYAEALGLANQAITGYPVKADARQDLLLIGKRYNLANSCVGQGPVLVTPVQVTALINTIASGGVYYQPRLVMGLSDDAGHLVRQFNGPAPRRAVAEYTADRLRALLRQVTVSGVGKKAEVPGWGSAGKTGSAQVAGEEGPVNAWFAGYVPAERPQYVITVLVRGGKSGGATAAPLFREIASRIMELN